MNKGTPEGTQEEIDFVIRLNKNKKDLIWSSILPDIDSAGYFAIHIKGHKNISSLGISVNPKADVFIAEGIIPEVYLNSQNYYLAENDAENFKLKPVLKSGISIKRSDSASYQISKISPNTFVKIFGDYELGAGASIYSSNPAELIKNPSVLEGWHTDFEKFNNYFKNISDVKILNDQSRTAEERLRVAKLIKIYSCHKIEEMILSDPRIRDYIFSGEGFFSEPYCAHWIFERDKFKEVSVMPFFVTTGSGRSRGDFTVVVKPL